MNLSMTLGLLAVAAALSGCGRDDSAPATAAPSTAPAPPPPAARMLLAQLPPAYGQADLANGELHFNLCKPCHTVVRGGPDMTGPNLSGVFGRRVASKPDYPYSDALKSRTWTWDAGQLNVWLKSPSQYVPGTKMSFHGIADDQDRRDLIAYLKVASSGAPM